MRSLFALAIALISVPAWSTPIIVTDQSGELAGALGVNVNGALYDVTFTDGSCQSVFDGCDELGDFEFNDRDAALAASEALLNQVFRDTFKGPFDSYPRGIVGCSRFDQCRAFTPWGLDLDAFHEVFIARADNFDGRAPDRTALQATHDDADFSPYTYIVWADWQRVVSASEPATLGLFLLGLSVIARRRPA